jgi:hypothetical protein
MLKGMFALSYFLLSKYDYRLCLINSLSAAFSGDDKVC